MFKYLKEHGKNTFASGFHLLHCKMGPQIDSQIHNLAIIFSTQFLNSQIFT
jgi:hypothetical protein